MSTGQVAAARCISIARSLHTSITPVVFSGPWISSRPPDATLLVYISTVDHVHVPDQCEITPRSASCSRSRPRSEGSVYSDCS